jgi:hypothetical protein
MKMWGFCLKKSISREVIIYVSDDFIELNRFERLSKFNPKTAKWITDK